MGITSVTRNYQVTLTKDVREPLGITEGSRLFVEVDGDGIRMRAVKRSGVEESFGMLKGRHRKGESSVEIVRRMRAESEKRLKRLWGEHEQSRH